MVPSRNYSTAAAVLLAVLCGAWSSGAWFHEGGWRLFFFACAWRIFFWLYAILLFILYIQNKVEQIYVILEIVFCELSGNSNGRCSQNLEKRKNYDRWPRKRDVARFSFQTIKKRNRLKILSYRRLYGKWIVFILFIFYLENIIRSCFCTRRNLCFHFENSHSHADQKQLTRR